MRTPDPNDTDTTVVASPAGNQPETTTAEKAEQDGILDEALRETFPASDPIASGKFD